LEEQQRIDQHAVEHLEISSKFQIAHLAELQENVEELEQLVQRKDKEIADLKKVYSGELLSINCNWFVVLFIFCL
jgi:hypothetical protein